MRRRLVSVLSVVMLVGCSSATSSTTIAPGSTAENPADAIRASLAGSGQLVLQYTYEGGLAADTRDTLIAPFSLYADGRLLVPGDEPSVSSQRPVVRPVDLVRLTDTELNAIYELIVDIGLPEFDREFGTIPGVTVADAGNEVVSYFDSIGGAHRYSVHALFALEDQPAAEPIRAMKELRDLLQAISEDPASRIPVEPDRIQLVLLDPPSAGGLVLEWPLGIEPADFVEIEGIGPCHVMTGEDVAAALEAFSQGSVTTLWDLDGTRWRLWGRHLLENEIGCTGANN